jgi:pilus assembly protein CpaB
MSMRAIVLVLFALGAALGTVFFAQNWMDAQRAAMAAQVPEPPPESLRTEVLVMKENLPSGSFVKPEHLRWQPWPDGNLAPSYVVKGTRELNDFVGAVVRTGISGGEPITDGRVVKPGDRGFLAAVLEPGKRAISVSINATTGISGLVFPGDRVDLILTHNIPEETEGKKKVRRASETVLHNIRVLAVDQTVDDQTGEPEVAKTATLEVTPKQAEAIAVVTELGRLSLSLRSLAREDGTDEDANPGSMVDGTPTFTLDTDVSLLLERPAQPKRARGPVVNVVRGLKSATQEVVPHK